MGTKRVRSHPLPSETWARKVRGDPCPQNPVQQHLKAQHATGVAGGHIWVREIREASFSVGLEGGRMIDKAQCAYLFYDLVSRSDHKPEILFHLPSQD